MNIIETPLDGLLIIEPKCFQDERGFFLESFQAERYQEVGIIETFVQDNQSRSKKNVLRGMHFQVKNPQAKIITVMRGHIFDVGVDLRSNSPTFGRWFGVELCDAGPRQIYMAPGFAHGFCVLSEWADLHYKVSCKYDAFDEAGVNWGDVDVGVVWPVDNPIVATRDSSYPNLKDLNFDKLPHSKEDI